MLHKSTFISILVMLVFWPNSLKAQTVKLFGNYNLSLDKNNQSSSTNTAEFSVKLVENSNFSLSLSNALCVDLDHFNNEIKETNVFTTLKFEF